MSSERPTLDGKSGHVADVQYKTGLSFKQTNLKMLSILTLSSMGFFKTHVAKCSGRGFSKGHPQQEVLQGQELSGMGCLRTF